MVLCTYCKHHSSKRLRACISCRAEALPSCRPERCMILAGLTSTPGLDINRSAQARIVCRETDTGWTLCCWCLRERLAAMFRSLAIRNCRCTGICVKCCILHQYYIVADIISHYCGGPWIETLAQFYWDTYPGYRLLNTWCSNEGEEPQRVPTRPVRIREWQWYPVILPSPPKPIVVQRWRSKPIVVRRWQRIKVSNSSSSNTDQSEN